MRPLLVGVLVLIGLSTAFFASRSSRTPDRRPARPVGVEDTGQVLEGRTEADQRLEQPPPSPRWEEYRPQATLDPTRATWFIAAGGLDHVGEEEEREVCRTAVAPLLSTLGTTTPQTIVDGVLEGERERLLLDQAVQNAGVTGFDPEVLAAIREPYLGQLRTLAQDYTAELDGAIQATWSARGEVSWRSGEPDPGVGADRVTKPIYSTASQAGPWSFRVSIWAEDHPRVANARRLLQDSRDAALRAQMEYLESFR